MCGTPQRVENDLNGRFQAGDEHPSLGAPLPCTAQRGQSRAERRSEKILKRSPFNTHSKMYSSKSATGRYPIRW